MKEQSDKTIVWVENGETAHKFFCSEYKKNIFLIGDSIRRGYCATVKENLADIAQVFYVDENCRSTQFVIFSLKKWAEMFDRPELVDIVHFNCGHWDVAHWNGYSLSLTSEDEYAKNIQMIITLLRHFFPNAQLVFATTTPMNPDGGSIGGINPRSNESIEKYNKIASRIAMENGVEINDLNKYMKNWESKHYIDTCHLTPDSFAVLGKEVARVLYMKMENK